MYFNEKFNIRTYGTSIDNLAELLYGEGEELTDNQEKFVKSLSDKYFTPIGDLISFDTESVSPNLFGDKNKRPVLWFDQDRLLSELKSNPSALQEHYKTMRQLFGVGTDNPLRLYNALTEQAYTDEDVTELVAHMTLFKARSRSNVSYKRTPTTNEELFEVARKYGDDKFAIYMLEWADSTYFLGLPVNRFVELSDLFMSHQLSIHQLLTKRAKKLEELREKQSQPNYLSPNDGGCWFCSTNGTDLFDTEFDTNLHSECLKEVLAKEPEHPEARSMRHLLDGVTN